MNVEGKLWHMGCFTCSFPGHNSQLTLRDYTIASGKPYCKTHCASARSAPARALRAHPPPSAPLPDMAMFHEKGNYDSLMGEMEHPAIVPKRASGAARPERRRAPPPPAPTRKASLHALASTGSGTTAAHSGLDAAPGANAAPSASESDSSDDAGPPPSFDADRSSFYGGDARAALAETRSLAELQPDARPLATALSLAALPTRAATLTPPVRVALRKSSVLELVQQVHSAPSRRSAAVSADAAADAAAAVAAPSPRRASASALPQSPAPGAASAPSPRGAAISGEALLRTRKRFSIVALAQESGAASAASATRAALRLGTPPSGGSVEGS